jgi:UDP-N-acetylglucosamine 2-epimerase (non-hydrolysing)
LREPDCIIADGVKGEPLRRKGDAIRWLWSIRRWLRANRRSLRASIPSGSAIVVHGDTMTSVVGAYIARRLGVDSVHVEAGLRSGNWRHPFPEELDRRIVGRLATVHYTPSEEATRNLRGRPNVVHTHGNTALDAVLDQTHMPADAEEPYGVVLLHRFEFLNNPELVASTFKTLAEHSRVRLKFFVDAYANEVLANVLPGLSGSAIEVTAKQSHEEFVSTLRGARFIVTDSGGIQEEAALLGVPTLIHRRATERHDGLGENIVLSEWRLSSLVEFLENAETFARPLVVPEHSPSDIIVADLLIRGYAGH